MDVKRIIGVGVVLPLVASIGLVLGSPALAAETETETEITAVLGSECTGDNRADGTPSNS